MNKGPRVPGEARSHLSQRDWGQDEVIDAGPLNENELKGSRQKHDREHYGSVRSSYPRGPHPRERRSFAGVGPKNYKRSDECIEEEVCNILMKDHNIDASNIEVHVRNGVVILSGTVYSRMDRTEAELAIEGVAGVEDIQNDIKLKKWGDYSDRPYPRERD